MVEDADKLLAAVAAQDTFAGAMLLFEARPSRPTSRGASGRIAFQREVQPWRVRAMAQRPALDEDAQPAAVADQGLRAKGLRAAEENEDQRHAKAALKILAGHPSLEAKLELMRACGSMPNGLRVHAVNAMAKDAELELIPTLLDLLKDREPNVRIAACNAIGEAMRPHVDETEGQQPTGDLLKQRDQAIKKLAALVKRDKVWQVRSAAAFSLANMRCKAVIPALIAGLDAELKRKKDPWAMDVRLHKPEGLTGQSVARGSIAPWKAFWKAEGSSFTVRPSPRPGRNPQRTTATTSSST